MLENSVRTTPKTGISQVPPACLCGLTTTTLTPSNKENGQYYTCPKSSVDPSRCGFMQRLVAADAPEDGATPGKQSGNCGAERGDPSFQQGAIDGVQPQQKKNREAPGNENVTAPLRTAMCFRCGEIGHSAKDCPVKSNSLGNDKSIDAEEIKRESQLGGHGGNADGGSMPGVCFHCHQSGHWAKECPTKRANEIKRKTCFRCKQEGHWVRDCPLRYPPAATKMNASSEAPSESIEAPKPLPPPSATANKDTSKPVPPAGADMNPVPPEKKARMIHPLPDPKRVRKLPLSMRGGSGFGLPDTWFYKSKE